MQSVNPTISKEYTSSLFAVKLKAYWELMKPRLSFLVAFSAAFGYMLASYGNINLINVLLFSLGGYLLSASSVIFNQILEVPYDLLMKRTQNRPLPTGRVTKWEAGIYAIVLLVVSLVLIYTLSNVLTLVLSIVSFVLYSFIYTPLKRVGPIAVFVGAIPGALPPLLGWVAYTGVLSHEALIIFGIQFIWQFPHFWAIAWVADDDYKKAGFKLLPSGGKKDLNTALQIMIYTLFLIPLGLLPAKFGITGINSALIATFCGVAFLSQTFYLMKDGTRNAALRIMFGSFLYLPITQIAFLLDRL